MRHSAIDGAFEYSFFVPFVILKQWKKGIINCTANHQACASFKDVFLKYLEADRDITAQDVAKIFLKLVPMSHLKLQKMIYLAYKDYLVKLANMESSFNPIIKNKYGYEGLYQFGDSALRAVGMTRQDLRSGTLNQHIAALRLAEENEKALGNLASQYIGKEYRGVKVTKNGIRAAAHLLGAGSVQDWFRGTTRTDIARNGFVDGNGTHITEYFKLFA